MKLLLIYWSFMLVGFFIARRLANMGKQVNWVSRLLMICVYMLCFVMGLRMGVNEQVTSNLGTIGLKSLLITVVCILASMGAVTITRLLLQMDKYGDKKKAGRVSAEEHQDNVEGFDMKSTLIIISIVAIGMILGALVIVKYFDYYLASFDVITSNTLVALLCILLFFVGFDLGFSGQLLSSLKNVGWKIIVFPIVSMAGTLIVGTLVCMIMGFSLRESLAICLGFGWYSYAPVVIANAGQTHIIASAVSFMHNVMREMAGIIFIPLVAKKIGYIETTAMPGSAAMDVCLSIVERSCRTDTVIYSFTTGLIMCITTSIGVPLVMGG